MNFEEWLGSKMAIADIRDITSEMPDTINAAVECIAELAYKAGQMSCAPCHQQRENKEKELIATTVSGFVCLCPQGSVCEFFDKENETCRYGEI